MFRNRMPRYEVLSEEAMATLDRGWRRLMTEIGVEFMDDRALDLFRAGGPAGRGQHGLPRPRLRARAGRQGAARVRPPGPQPGATRSTSAATRWRSARSTGRRSSARATSAATATMEDFRNFSRLAQSFSVLDSAGGVVNEPNDTPLDSRHLDMTYALQTLTDKIYMGNVVSGVNARGHHRDDRDPVRLAGGDRGDAGAHLADQLQLAAALGRPDARGAVRVLRRRPARRADAVHPDGRDVAGHDPGRAGAADRRGAVGHRALPADPARGAGGLRLVPVQHRHAVRLADVRHARSRASGCCAPGRSPATSGCRSAPAAGSRPRRSPTPRPATRR